MVYIKTNSTNIYTSVIDWFNHKLGRPTYPIEWIRLNGASLEEFLILKNLVIGEYLYSSMLLQELFSVVPFEALEDVIDLDTFANIIRHRTDSLMQLSVYSATDVSSLADFGELLKIVARIENIQPIEDPELREIVNDALHLYSTTYGS